MILLRFIADLSIEEVASLTGRSAGAVRSLQHRAMSQLARTMRPADAADRVDG